MILSNERKLGIFEKFFPVEKHKRWLKKLGKHKVFLFLDTMNIHRNSFVIEELVRAGVKVIPDKLYQDNIVDYILLDIQKVQSPNDLSIFQNNETFISLWDKHLVDIPFVQNRSNKILCSSTLQIENFLIKNQIRDYKFSSRYNYRAMTANQNIELSIVGHPLTSFVTEECDEEIATDNFITTLPTVSYYGNGLLRKKSVIKGLEKLSSFANIIVLTSEPMKFMAKNIVVLPLEKLSQAVNIAKVNLVSVYSEELVTMLMHNHQILPVFTWFMDSYRQHGKYLPHVIKEDKKDRFVPFTEILRQNSTANEFLHYITPIDIEDTKYLSYVIKNSVFWNKYNKNIGRICSELLGTYFNDDIERRLVQAIENILKYDKTLPLRKVL